MEQGHGKTRRDEADQRARDAGADLRRDDGGGQHADADRQRVDIRLPKAADDMDELQQDMALLVGDTQKGRQLTDDDVDRDSGQESRGDRN